MSDKRQFFEDLQFLATCDPQSLEELRDEYLRVAPLPQAAEQFDANARTFVFVANGLQLKAEFGNKGWRIIQ